MPPNFGILPELESEKNKQQRYGAYRDRALADLASGLGFVIDCKPGV